MRIGLLTDAPKHNLALMKISQWHKQQGHEVILGKPADVVGCEKVYGSYLFRQRDHADIVGGPGVDPIIRLAPHIEDIYPDYSLFNIDYSLGYTWEYCPRKCGFCVVPKQNNPKVHRSIWEFHEPKFKKICLLNNNTFSDPQWRETFEEIWDADLTVTDENGYDLRLIDEEKVGALHRTRFDGLIHFAWDRIKDEAKILDGLSLAQQLRHRSMVYVLTGYDTTIEEDIHRCQLIYNTGFDPFVMIYNNRKKRQLRQFRRMINLTRCYRRYPTIEAAWSDYRG